MRTTAHAMQPILHSFSYALDYLREQLDDVPDDAMAVQPLGIANHPSWMIGHLVHTCQMIGGVIGVPEWLPRDWAKRYGTGSVPLQDARAYESKDRLLSVLRDAQVRISTTVIELDAPRLDEPFPDESYRDVFPTVRHALTQVLVGHTSMHVGQVTVWRKAMRFASMRRSFE